MFRFLSRLTVFIFLSIQVRFCFCNSPFAITWNNSGLTLPQARYASFLTCGPNAQSLLLMFGVNSTDDVVPSILTLNLTTWGALEANQTWEEHPQNITRPFMYSQRFAYSNITNQLFFMYKASDIALDFNTDPATFWVIEIPFFYREMWNPLLIFADDKFLVFGGNNNCPHSSLENCDKIHVFSVDLENRKFIELHVSGTPDTKGIAISTGALSNEPFGVSSKGFIYLLGGYTLDNEYLPFIAYR